MTGMDKKDLSAAAIADVTGNGDVDGTINSIIAALENYGIVRKS